MANLILTSDGWQNRIRSKLGLDVAYLPDADIEQPDVISVAEANIIRQITNYSNLSDPELVYLEAAVVCECCILLCNSLSARLPIREQGPHESHDLDIDWDKRKGELEVERDYYIGSVVVIPTLYHFRLSR